MKYKFLKYILPVFAIVAMFAFAAWNNEKAEMVTLTDPDTGKVETFEFAAPRSYSKTFALDTLTGTTPDTITVPWIMASPFQYEIYMKLRKLTGTPNTKMVLDSRTVTNGIWSPIDSVTCGGADSVKVHFRLRSTVAYGTQYRVRFVRSGSHSLARNVQMTIKPPNQ